MLDVLQYRTLCLSKCVKPPKSGLWGKPAQKTFFGRGKLTPLQERRLYISWDYPAKEKLDDNSWDYGQFSQRKTSEKEGAQNAKKLNLYDGP